MTAGKQEDRKPLYMQANSEDFSHIDLTALLQSNQDAELFKIAIILREASQKAETSSDLSSARALAALSGIASFHFTPENLNEPFGPMMIMGDKRSAIPSDYLGDTLVGLETIAESIENTALRARICDMIWLLKRSNHQCGKQAAQTYHDLANGVREGKLTLTHSAEGELGFECVGFLRRALAICRGLRNPADLHQPIVDTVAELRAKAMADQKHHDVRNLSKLSLDFELVNPVEIAQELEQAISWVGNLQFQADFWSLASLAYKRAKDDANRWRCRTECAESNVKQGETLDLAMLKSHWFAKALVEFQGIPNQKERRTELRHLLIDAQAHIGEEMSQYSHPMDLTELVENTKERLKEASAFGKLGILASIHRSADPDALKADAVKQIQDHPLSSLFGKSQHDAEGKVIHKTSGGGIGEAEDQAIIDKIAEGQTVMRSIVVASAITPALYSISGENYPNNNDIEAICLNSPFIPVDRQFAYFEGLRNFLFGNHLNALNILGCEPNLNC